MNNSINYNETLIFIPGQDEEEPDAPLTFTDYLLVVGIFIVMVGVGASCDRTLLKTMIRSPPALKAACIGCLCQFLIMPLLAYLLALLFGVDDHYTALGFLLVGCMPGGNASNVFTLWGAGVLELSVFMTLVSMVVSFGMTPLCLYVYSQALGLDASVLALREIGLAFALLLVPLTIGLSLHCFPCTRTYHQRLEKGLSIFAFVLFALVIALLIKDYAPAMAESADYRSIVPAVLISPLSFVLAYTITTILKLKPAIKRTIVFEVSFQNVAMGFAIGTQIVPKQSDRDKTVPFPLVYGTTQFAWAALLIPLFQWQKRYNERHQIADLDPEFLVREVEEVPGAQEEDETIPAKPSNIEPDSLKAVSTRSMSESSCA